MLSFIVVCTIILLGLTAAIVVDRLIVDCIKRARARKLWGEVLHEVSSEMPEEPESVVIPAADRRYRKLARERSLPIHLDGTRSILNRG